MHILTNLTAVKLPEKHLDSLITAIRQLQETPHHISQVMVLAAADLISPSRLCGLWQWALADTWNPLSQNWDLSMPTTQTLRQVLVSWTHQQRLCRGVPLARNTASLSFYRCVDLYLGCPSLSDLFSSSQWSHDKRSWVRNAGSCSQSGAIIFAATQSCFCRTTPQLWLILAISAVLVSATFFHLKTYILLFCDASNIILAVRRISGHFNVMSDGLVLSQDLCLSCSGPVVLDWSSLDISAFSPLSLISSFATSGTILVTDDTSLRSIRIERGWHRCNSAFDSLPHVCRSSQVCNDSKQSQRNSCTLGLPSLSAFQPGWFSLPPQHTWIPGQESSARMGTTEPHLTIPEAVFILSFAGAFSIPWVVPSV